MLVREFLETVNPDQNVDVYMEIPDNRNIILSQSKGNRLLHYCRKLYDIYSEESVSSVKFEIEKTRDKLNIIIDIK